MKEFIEFGINFVVEQDLPEFKKIKSGNNSYDMDCPFCGGKRKFNVNFKKNLARCNKCSGTSGYNSITLHAALTGLSNSESYKDLVKRWNGLETEAKVKLLNQQELSDKPQVEPADIACRDMVYRKLLENLSLSKKHKDDLKRRGLTDEQIENGMYKSVPVVGLHTLAYDAVYNTEAYKMIGKKKGIPGFLDIHSKNKISLRGKKTGYFIPVLTYDGKISALQIRYDDLSPDATDEEKERYKKYSWYSSGDKETGCSVSGCENIHFAGDFRSIVEEINLTEGVLKSDVAHALSGKNFVGIVGVNNVKQLQSTLWELQFYNKLKKVHIYIDMDYKEKKEVASALANIKKIINSAGNHDIKLISDNSGNVDYVYFDRKDGKENGANLVMSFKEDLPSKLIIYAGKSLVPNDEYEIIKNRIVFSCDYSQALRNDIIPFHVSDATNEMFKGFNKYTLEQKQAIIRKSLISDFTIEKTGLVYEEHDWLDSKKGIDDYYLYLKSIGQL